MLARTTGYLGLGVALAALVAAQPATAQQGNPSHTHIGHVSSGFAGVPDGLGLLPIALAEAAIAAQHAGFAARDLSNLQTMKQHAAHALHALDPSAVAQGPGRGYGVKRASEGIAQHIGMASSANGASSHVTTHSEHISTSARNTAQRADQAIALARRIEAASTAAEAAPLVEQLRDLTEQLTAGRDANGDGRIGWQEGEGGLQQVEQHLNLMVSAEGL
jgi:hypothetical protein